MDIPYAGGAHGNQAAPFGISSRPAPPPSSCAVSRFIWIFIIRAEVSLAPCHHCLQDRYAFYLDVRGEEIGMIEQMQMLELFPYKPLCGEIRRPPIPGAASSEWTG